MAALFADRSSERRLQPKPVAPVLVSVRSAVSFSPDSATEISPASPRSPSSRRARVAGRNGWVSIRTCVPLTAVMSPVEPSTVREPQAGVGRILVGDPNVADQRHRGDRGPFEARGAVHQRVEPPGHHRPGRHRRDQRRRDQPRNGERAGRRTEGDQPARRDRRQSPGHLLAEGLHQRRRRCAARVGGRHPGELDRGQQIAGHFGSSAPVRRAAARSSRNARAGTSTPRASTTSAERAGEAGRHRGPEISGADGGRRNTEREQPDAQRRRPVARRLEAGAQQEPPPHGREEALDSVPLAHHLRRIVSTSGAARPAWCVRCLSFS